MKITHLLLCAGLVFPCSFTLAQTSENEDYTLRFDKAMRQTKAQSELSSVGLAIGNQIDRQKVLVPLNGTPLIYNDLTDTVADALIGEKLSVTCDYNGIPMHAYFYIDYNQDGQFTVAMENNHLTTGSELVAYTYYEGKNSEGTAVEGNVSVQDMPVYTIPADIPAGMYRARVKLDKNNVDPAGSVAMADEGGCIVDFLLNVRHKDGKLDLQTVNGSIVGESNWGVPKRIDFQTPINLMPVAIAEGYEPGDITIRHGQNLDGEQYIHGNRQWEEYTLPYQDLIEIPAEKVNGDVRVSLRYEATDAAEYTLQFCDEFNQPDGSMPDDSKWVRCYSWGSTWDRTNAQTPEGQKQTAYIEDGKLVALCIKNPFDDEQLKGVRRDMISGAVESHSKFDFTYGKVEGRLATNAYKGNFPAFWMMPSKAEHGDWPMDGEIDIFEQIDYEDISYHTVHTNWTFNMGMANNPPKGGTSYTITGDYHVYTFEWTEDKLTWYVDGQPSFSYAKSRDPYAIENLQWPFYKDFYLILNQSVGNGSWARPCDVNHVYRTDFDWVRVYQKGKSVNPDTGIEEIETKSDLDVYGFRGVVHLVAVDPVRVHIVDTLGRVVYNQKIQGNVDVALAQGLYIVNGKKVWVK